MLFDLKIRFQCGTEDDDSMLVVGGPDWFKNIMTSGEDGGGGGETATTTDEVCSVSLDGDLPDGAQAAAQNTGDFSAGFPVLFL